MKKRTWVTVMVVSFSLCLVLAYYTLISWRVYRMACDNLEQIKRIMTEIEDYQQQRAKELESYIADSVNPVLDGDELLDLSGRLWMPYAPPPVLSDIRAPR